MLDILGRIWDLPNTVAGGAWALLNRTFVGESIFADGVLYVENAPLQPEGSAITLGEVWCWRAREGKLSGHFNQALRSPHTN